MAKFVWVGGSTLAGAAVGNCYSNPLGNFSGRTGSQNMDWILAFDYNNPANWRTQNSWNGPYVIAKRSPSANDEVVLGLGFTGSAYTTIPTAIAPCLWGGCTNAGSTGTVWPGGGPTGTVLIQSLVGVGGRGLQSFNIGHGGGRRGTQYPFKFIGTPTGFASCASGNSYTSPILDAEAAGFTFAGSVLGWGDYSWEDLVNAVVATGAAGGTAGALAVDRLNNITIKTPYVVTNKSYDGYIYFGSYDPQNGNPLEGRPLRSEPNHGFVGIKILKDKYGISGGYLADTYCDLRGPAEYKLSGYPTRIYRQVFVPISGTTAFAPPTDAPFYAPRGHLLLTGATVAELDASNVHGVLLDSTTNISIAKIQPANKYNLIQIQNKFNRTAVLNDIWYGAGASFAGASAENLSISSPAFAFSEGANSLAVPNGGGGGINYYGIVLGSPGITVSVDSISIGGQLSFGHTLSSGPISTVNVAGNLLVNTLRLNNHTLRGWQEGGIDPEATVQIGQLEMSNYSKLDFNNTENFDGWQFGILGSTSGQIQGGIIFMDELSTIVGSKGMRLWNEQLIFGGQALMGNGPSKKTGSYNIPPKLTAES